MNKDIWAGIAGAVVLHAAILFVAVPMSVPHHEVIVAPSALEVALVKSPPKKVENKIEPPVEEPPVKEPEPVIEPPPVEEAPLPEIIEEPEIIREEPLPEPLPEPEPLEEIIEEEPEPVVEEIEITQINEKEGVSEDVQPMRRYNKPPAYPRQARRKGWEGRVVLDVLVSKDGAVLSIDILESSGHGILDREAVKAVSGWKFEPARLFGKPVEKRINLPILYDLQYEED